MSTSRFSRVFLLFGFAVALLGCGKQGPEDIPVFDGARALEDVAHQVSLGPRTPGSDAHAQAVDWYLEQLAEAGWQAAVQESEYGGYPIRNVVATRGTGQPWYILGAHYDSRIYADLDPDPDMRRQPVPGANDGASGVALLLELARVLPADWPGKIWIVLFDAEDQGNIEGRDWIMGSRAFAEQLEGQPDGVVIVDMIGDADLSIPLEGNSNVELRDELWTVAAQLGYGDVFLPEVKYHIIDDHLPFVELGIPAVDIIDLDYAYWHTIADTTDKVSAESLQAVGDVLLAWLMGQ